MTSDQAAVLLRDYLPILREAWLFGWDEHLPRLHPYFSTSCRSQMIQNLAVGRAKEVLGDRIRSLSDQNAELLVFPGISVIRFKKLSSQLLPTNNHTDRSRGFYSQMNLRGLPDFTRLVCGAKVSSDWTTVDGIFLVQPRSTRANNWALDITHTVEEIDSSQIRFDLDEVDEPFFTFPEDDDNEQHLEQST